MKRLLLAALLATASPVAAQWSNVPAPGIPKKADGSPNLNAPAPRAADGKPDFSGVWRPDRNQKCPPDGCPDNQMSEQFLDLGWGLKDGLPYQPWAAALVKERSEQMGKDDPTSNCFPGGIVRLHTYPTFNKIVQTPRLLLILSEREVTYRQIFMDGRKLPNDPLPTWKGYSVGHWDGDTLVVDSNGFRGEQHTVPAVLVAEQIRVRCPGRMLRALDDHGANPPRELRTAGDAAHRERSEGLHEAIHRHPQRIPRARR